MKYILIFTIFAIMSNGQIPVIETQKFRSLENCKITGNYLVAVTKQNDKYRRLKNHITYKCVELKPAVLR